MSMFYMIYITTLLGIICTSIYFLPYIIAKYKNVIDEYPIFYWNFLTGWTIIGWIGTLIWAVVIKKEINHGYRND